MTGFVRIVAAVLFAGCGFLSILALDTGGPVPRDAFAPLVATALIAAPALYLLAEIADGVKRIAEQ